MQTDVRPTMPLRQALAELERGNPNTLDPELGSSQQNRQRIRRGFSEGIWAG